MFHEGEINSSSFYLRIQVLIFIVLKLNVLIPLTTSAIVMSGYWPIRYIGVFQWYRYADVSTFICYNEKKRCLG